MPVNMNIMSMQAESMVAAAVNKGKNFNKAATAFYKSANESGLEGNALIALHSSVRNASQSKNYLVSKLKSYKIYSALIDALESGSKENAGLKKQLKQFADTVNKKYHETLGVRISLASDGAVRPDEVHKSTRLERFVAGIKNLVRTE